MILCHQNFFTEETMFNEFVWGAFISGALLVYLAYTILHPEKF